MLACIYANFKPGVIILRGSCIYADLNKRNIGMILHQFFFFCTLLVIFGSSFDVTAIKEALANDIFKMG